MGFLGPPLILGTELSNKNKEIKESSQKDVNLRT